MTDKHIAEGTNKLKAVIRYQERLKILLAVIMVVNIISDQ